MPQCELELDPERARTWGTCSAAAAAAAASLLGRQYLRASQGTPASEAAAPKLWQHTLDDCAVHVGSLRGCRGVLCVAAHAPGVAAGAFAAPWSLPAAALLDNAYRSSLTTVCCQEGRQPACRRVWINTRPFCGGPNRHPPTAACPHFVAVPSGPPLRPQPSPLACCTCATHSSTATSRFLPSARPAPLPAGTKRSA